MEFGDKNLAITGRPWRRGEGAGESGEQDGACVPLPGDRAKASFSCAHPPNWCTWQRPCPCSGALIQQEEGQQERHLQEPPLRRPGWKNSSAERGVCGSSFPAPHLPQLLGLRCLPCETRLMGINGAGSALTGAQHSECCWCPSHPTPAPCTEGARTFLRSNERWRGRRGFLPRRDGHRSL